MVFRCPHCSEPFEVVKTGEPARIVAWRCANGHSFDVAREGYVNLCPQSSKFFGDSAAMLGARREFLRAGHFAPLDNAIAEILNGAASFGEAPVLLDAGCGEGSHLTSIPTNFGVAGMDLSKQAVRMAAKANPLGSFAVSDIFAPWPVHNQSVQVVLTMFAPRNALECQRVLKENGLWIVVYPHIDHLAELRERWPMVGVHPNKQNELQQQNTAAGFSQESQKLLSFAFTADAATQRTLVRMGPSAHHLDETILTELDALTAKSLQVHARIWVTIWRMKRAGEGYIGRLQLEMNDEL